MLVSVSYGFYFLIWIAFSPLIYLAFIKNCRRILELSIIYGLITSLFFFNWVYNVKIKFYLELYMLAILIFTLYFTIFLILISFFSKKIKDYYVILLPPLIWLFLLLVYQIMPIKIYWMDLSIFQPAAVPIIWYVGSYGVTFLIILSNSILSYYFIKKNRILLFFEVFLLMIILASLFYSNYSGFPYNGKKVKVALLQGNFPYEWKWRQNNAFGLILNTYLNMSYEASKNKPDMIIWPEYSLNEDILDNKTVSALLKRTAQQLNTTLIVGSLSYTSDKVRYKDTAFVFKPDGYIDMYNSTEPFFLDKEVVKGNALKIIEHQSNLYGIMMCNEESMQSIARDYSNKGSQFIISLSNNQDLGRGHSIISQFTRLRAAENAKYVVRATNDGITQIINPLGKVVNSIEPEKEKILIGEIYVNSYKTFYTKHGNILVYLTIIISTALILKKRKYVNKI
ncbi:MAG: nitrilase-related carbon-nitrogen hydrolase [Nanoarchaeota archaeon]